MASITVKNLSKSFKIPHQKKKTLLQNIVGLVKRQMTYEQFWALKDVSFEVRPGETFGIIGRNGSGKSTLLKILTKVLYAEAGSIEIIGKVASFLELGVGFQHELTARENVYLYSSILGMSRRQTDAIYEDIFKFAELERFQDMKLKSYSSGMYLRLAFATAIQTNPDILLVDEVLAVGDDAFKKKCMIKINEFRERGKTILFVSHDMVMVRKVCARSMLLHNGSILSMGATENVVSAYAQLTGGSN
jgi:lipopolysaccharide transport system ATP-binding protein